MSLGFRRRLLLLSVVFIAVVDLCVGVYLEWRLRTSLQGRFGDELTRHARVVGEALEGTAPTGDVDTVRARLDPLADRYGEALQARVSVIDPAGNLVADSDLSVPQLGRADNHGDREEVRAARGGVVGTARRHSATLDTEMLYVAHEVDDGSGRIVRVSVPLSQVDDALAQLRLSLALGGLAALAAAGLLAMAATRLLSRSLRALVASAQDEAGVRSRLDAHDEPQSVNALADDLRRTVRLLGHERERFETVLDTMRQAVIALDDERRIVTVNEAARQLLGLPAQVEGRPLLDFVRVPALQQLIDQATQGEAMSAELDYGMSPRRRIQAQVSASRVGGGCVIVLQDVTELRRLETVRKDFVANVSHELRTPVAVIKANAETLLAGAIHEPAKASKFLDALVRHADRLGRLVADLLDISRIEEGRYGLEIEPVELSEVIARTLAALSTLAQERGTDLRSHVQQECWLAGDDRALEQVLFNLISNAIRYTQPGAHVEVVASPVPGSEGESGEPRLVRIEVRDDGPGIDPRHHARVFERFYRVDTGRARDRGGTGLGLAIVKHLVEAMGGQAGVEARRPRGSIFWFTMPTAVSVFGAGPVDDDDEDADEDAEQDEPALDDAADAEPGRAPIA